MTRKAIMIGSPGPKNSANYLKGVNADLHHIKRFLKSPNGGSWEDHEIEDLSDCTLENLMDIIQEINTDYLLVYFSGHGHQDLKETIIALKTTETISITNLISFIKASKALIIIDTCRKGIHDEYESFTGPDYLSFKSTLNQPNTREKFMNILAESHDGIAIAYACSVGEISNDTELGGHYTYSLLRVSLEWFEMCKSESVLFIHEANDLAHQDLKFTTHSKQNPQLVNAKGKEENLNFPFALKLISL
jgi:uncharacterized protein